MGKGEEEEEEEEEEELNAQLAVGSYVYARWEQLLCYLIWHSLTTVMMNN